MKTTRCGHKYFEITMVKMSLFYLRVSEKHLLYARFSLTYFCQQRRVGLSLTTRLIWFVGSSFFGALSALHGRSDTGQHNTTTHGTSTTQQPVDNRQTDLQYCTSKKNKDSPRKKKTTGGRKMAAATWHCRQFQIVLDCCWVYENTNN